MTKRKPNVTQESVNLACQQLLQEDKSVSVNAVLRITGGSFTTVGTMVKIWREEQEQESTPVLQMPDRINTAMHKAVAELWTTASTLATEEMEHVKRASRELVSQTQTEMAEYAEEILRLEEALDTALQEKDHLANQVINTKAQNDARASQISTLDIQLKDRDIELDRLREEYSSLQTELIAIAKTQTEKDKPTNTLENN